MSGWERNPSGSGIAPAVARGSAAVSARDALAGNGALPAAEPAPARPVPVAAPPRRLAPAPASGREADPASGPYLGGDGSHRVSFSVLEDRIRNLRVDGRQMASSARIANGRLRAQHMGFEIVAEWIDTRHVEGRVRMRGRWGRGVTFSFTARHRVGDVLSG